MIPVTKPYRVMVVDDSFTVRALVAHMCDQQSDIDIVASASNGQAALDAMPGCKPDVITLDVEMPMMNGLEAIPKFLALDPDVSILMVSALTHKNAETSLRALRAGALDYLAKPVADSSLTLSHDFQHDLIGKIHALGALTRRRRDQHRRPKKSAAALPLQRRTASRPDIIAIGASTGGPAAIFHLLKRLHGKITQPIVITQHMPSHFTTVLAQHITRHTGITAYEAEDGMVLQNGLAYVARGDFHLTFEKSDSNVSLKCDSSPLVNFCRPSVDVMLQSLTHIYGDKVLAVMLTGMGQDGLNGCRAVFQKGGTVLAQSENSAVVWGMPGAVAHAGICSDVADLDDLAARIIALANLS